MEENQKKIMTQAEYARHRGVSKALITQAIQSGRITTDMSMEGGRLINVEEADRQWDQNTFAGNRRNKNGDSVIADEAESESEPKEVSSSGTSYAKSRAAREAVMARLAHLELQRKMGNLVDAKQVEQQAFADGRKIRNALTSIPDRLAPILAAEMDVAITHAILAKEINSTLKGLAVELGEST